MRRKNEEFAQALREAEVGLFFFAGHGFQVNGRNYIVPIDATLQDANEIDQETIATDALLQSMSAAAPDAVTIMILDACRNNPLLENLASSPHVRSRPLLAHPRAGLAEVRAGVNSLIAFATQPGNTASDGAGTNSPFTASLAPQY
jgi:uncharacterized caspase-like protein